MVYVPEEVFRYEGILSNDVAEFRRLLTYLKLSFSDKLVSKAVERSRFKNVKKMELKHGHSKNHDIAEGFQFVRSGASGDWQDYFSEADELFYQKLADK